MPRPQTDSYTALFAPQPGPEALNEMMVRDDSDPLAPQREAAFFYGLWLRGHSADALRQDIDIPRTVLKNWLRAKDVEAEFRHDLQRVYEYRKQVLAVFDALVSNEQNRLQLQ